MGLLATVNPIKGVARVARIPLLGDTRISREISLKILMFRFIRNHTVPDCQWASTAEWRSPEVANIWYSGIIIGIYVFSVGKPEYRFMVIT